MIETGSMDRADLVFAETHDTRIPALAERTANLRTIAGSRFSEKLYLDWA
jgi:hypothetical protein